MKHHLFSLLLAPLLLQPLSAPAQQTPVIAPRALIAKCADPTLVLKPGARRITLGPIGDGRSLTLKVVHGLNINTFSVLVTDRATGALRACDFTVSDDSVILSFPQPPKVNGLDVLLVY